MHNPSNRVKENKGQRLWLGKSRRRPRGISGTLLVGMVLTAVAAGWGEAAGPPPARPDFLIIIADDLSYGSLGWAGGVAPGVTPNLDKLAGESASFTRAHVTASVCQPSRQSMFSGQYPHRYGSVDFWPMRAGTPTVTGRLAEAGYWIGGLAKLQHMKPEADFAWSVRDEDLDLGVPIRALGRNPRLLAEGVSRIIREARRQGKPFCAVVNAEDPHRPFPGDAGEREYFEEGLETLPAPSRIYRPEEVRVPETLPDLPEIRVDLARYASAVRRLDDVVGACLAALEEAGEADNTVVVFVSDNGMPLPFGKFDTYLESTRTPLLVRWRGRLPGGQVDDRHLVSLADLAPTLIEMADARTLGKIDGRSLWPLLEGKSPVDWRKELVTLRYEEIYYGEGVEKGEKRAPGFRDRLRREGWVDRPEHEEPGTMTRPNNKRAILDGEFLYIYNHFFDGTPKQAFPYADPVYRAMEKAAREDEVIAERVRVYRFRSQEELYHYAEDPACRRNLVEDPRMKAKKQGLQASLRHWMEGTGDPAAGDFVAFLKAGGNQ